MDLLFSRAAPEQIEPLCNFGRGHYGEHSCEIILNLDQWFRRRCHLKKSLQMDNAGWTKTDHNSSPNMKNYQAYKELRLLDRVGC